MKIELKNAGLELLAPLGRGAYFARGAGLGVNTAALGRMTSLNFASPVTREMRLHNDFQPDRKTGLPASIPNWARAQKPGQDGELVDTAAAYAVFHQDVDQDHAVALVESHGARVVSRLISINALVIEIPVKNLLDLADEDALQWLEPPLPELSETNDSNRSATQAGQVQSAPYGLDGSGVVVLVYDGGTAYPHADFESRLSILDSSGNSSHPTHVAGTIGGAGVENATYTGMAPGCTLLSYGFEGAGSGFLYTDPGDLESDYNQAINTYGAVISNNSIGTNTAQNGFPCEWEGDYGVTAALIDNIVRGSLGSPIRIVWANGNERGSGRCGTEYLTTAPPACAKNHMTVGAMNSNNNSVTSFTSWGTDR